MQKAIWTVIALLLISLPTFAQDDEGEVVIDVAMVSSISVEEGEDISITIMGDLPDSCTEIGEISQSVEDDAILVVVETTRPADAMCATVMTAFEETYTLDTSDIEAGDYTLDVNGVTEALTIVASADAESVELTCPEADDDLALFNDLGICFLYPSENDVMIGNDFVLISQPLTSNALLLIQIEDAEDTTLEDIREQLEDDDVIVYDDTIGGQDTLIFERGIEREAIFVVNETIYHFVVQPIFDETGGILWAEVMNTVFFPEPDED